LRYQSPARAISLVGFMGTGKTTNGQRLAKQLGLQCVDTDDTVQRLAGKTIPEIFATDGEEAFRDLETRALSMALSGPRSVVGTGGGVVLRASNMEMMKSAGPVICLEARPETILARIPARNDRPLLQCADPAGRITQMLAERREAYAQADYTVQADYRDRSVVLGQMMRLLENDPRTTLMVDRRTRVHVKASNGEYRIHVEAGAFDRLARLCPPTAAGNPCVVVSSEAVAALYGEKVLGQLTCGGWRAHLVTVPNGEGAKTLQNASMLYDRFAEMGLDSGATVFALGGGVVGDLAGFAAATYRRGVRFAQLPTSLLAQVDASSGGKVAVNHPKGKNLIGTFYQPAGVVIDTASLQTLPERELRSGLAEVIKHAAIADAGMFAFLERELEAFCALDDIAVRYVLARNCQIKAGVVERDPYDRGARACLNYGHTVGHALERTSGDWELKHGEAVAIGMVAEARFALELGLCDEETVSRQEALIKRAGLPTHAEGVDIQQAREALRVDKKIASGRLRMPLVPRIGTVQILRDADIEALQGVLATVIGSGTA